MYTRGDSAWNNEAEACIGGYALMSSEKIRLFDNLSKRTVEFGVLLNETDASEVSNNHVERVKNPRGKPSLDTEGKGIFIYGGGINTVEGNSFEAAISVQAWPWAEKEPFSIAIVLSAIVCRSDILVLLLWSGAGKASEIIGAAIRAGI